METPIADIWSLPNVREALTIFARFAVLWKLLRVA